MGMHSDWLIEHADDVFCDGPDPYDPYDYGDWDDYSEIDYEMAMAEAAREEYICEAERKAMEFNDRYEAEMLKREEEELRIERIRDEEERREWEEAEGRRLYEEFQRNSSPGCLAIALRYLACVGVIYVVVFIFMCIFNSLGIATY